MALEILYEDNHVIVVNKKSSDIVQGDKTGDATLPDAIKSYLKKKYNKPGNVFCGVVHRLDRPTSGAVIFARTSKALERLNKQFREKETDKVYWAIVDKKPESRTGKLVHYLRKNENQNKSYVTNESSAGAKQAVLNYTYLRSSDKFHLLEIALETGRHHQIRVQLATINCHIKGDLKYGAKRSNEDGSICLHARKISFNHPTTNQLIEVIAPLPPDTLWQFFESK
jgi:23S rRNA pseudouridine1911/1915/1917 synthase